MSLEAAVGVKRDRVRFSGAGWVLVDRLGLRSAGWGLKGYGGVKRDRAVFRETRWV